MRGGGTMGLFRSNRETEKKGGGSGDRSHPGLKSASSHVEALTGKPGGEKKMGQVPVSEAEARPPFITKGKNERVTKRGGQRGNATLWGSASGTVPSRKNRSRPRSRMVRGERGGNG